MELDDVVEQRKLGGPAPGRHGSDDGDLLRRRDLARRLGGSGSQHTGTRFQPRRPGPARAEQELAKQYARGEIDETQFTHARSILHADDAD